MGCFQPNAGPKVPNTSGFSTSVVTQPSCLPSHLELQHIKPVKAEPLWGLELLMSLPPKAALWDPSACEQSLETTELEPPETWTDYSKNLKLCKTKRLTCFGAPLEIPGKGKTQEKEVERRGEGLEVTKQTQRSLSSFPTSPSIKIAILSCCNITAHIWALASRELMSTQNTVLRWTGKKAVMLKNKEVLVTSS